MPRLDDMEFTGFKGQNNSDPDGKLLPGHCRKATNVDFFRSTFGRKRGGASNVSLTGVSFANGIVKLIRYITDETEANTELWAIDGDGVIGRLNGSTTWATVSLDDAIATQRYNVRSISFNGKLFLAYDSTVNRLHVFDPVEGNVRRVGLATPAAPTGADTGSGSYSATERHYKVAYTVQASGVTVRRSELSAKLTATPSGSGSAYRVTKPAAISEDETHWELYASADDELYFLVATTVVGTTTYDDSTEPEDYTGDAPPLVGTNIPPPSAKYLIADDARIIMAGAWETAAGGVTTPHNSRVWWTPILGTNDVGDDERVTNITGVQASYQTVEEPITAIGGPIFGSFYVWSFRRMWKFVQSGNASAPYLRIPVANIGCIEHDSVIVAEDELGNPAIYWWSQIGPMRVGVQGVASLAEDILDEMEGLAIEASIKVAHGVYYPEKHQIWWYITLDEVGQTLPGKKLVYDTRLGIQGPDRVVRYGWSVHDGDSAKVRTSVMFSNTLGASMSADLVPYVSRNGDTLIWKTDTGTDDAGTDFQATVQTPTVKPWGEGRTGHLNNDPYVWAEDSAGVTLTLSVVRDYGLQTTTSTASIAPTSSETRVRGKFDGTVGADMEAVHFIVGDSAAVSNGWNVDSLIVPISAAGRDGTGD